MNKFGSRTISRARSPAKDNFNFLPIRKDTRKVPMPKAQLIIRNLLNVHTDAETSRRVKNDTMYNPGGVVIIGSHCDQFPLKYCSVWPKWNTSSIKGPGRSLEISNASPQSSTKMQRSKRLNFKKPVFDDMSLYCKGRKFKKVKKMPSSGIEPETFSLQD
jgi:hypothetical protein